MSNYLKIDKYSIENGPGVRISVFLSYCPLHCEGCHNPEAWRSDAGKAFTDDVIDEIAEAADSDYVAGLSILGGEPLAEYNLESTGKLIAEFNERHPEKTIWIWTGYEWNELRDRLLADSNDGRMLSRVLAGADVAVIGRFRLAEKDITKENLWRGSRNQRLLLARESAASLEPRYLSGVPNNGAE